MRAFRLAIVCKTRKMSTVLNDLPPRLTTISVNRLYTVTVEVVKTGNLSVLCG